MATRRMFAMTIIDSDDFLDMPLTTQALYFHLSMRADDEGFINNPKKIMRMIGASPDELKLLIGKKFVLSFDTGLVVIKHWLIHNQIRKDRTKDTVHIEERQMLDLKENGSYTFSKALKMLDGADCQPNDDQASAQVSIGKVSKEEVSIVEDKGKKPTQKQVFSNMISEYTSNDELIESIHDFIEMRKSIKSKPTERALKMILKELSKLASDDNTKILILNQSTMNCWKSIFPLKVNKNQNSIDTKVDAIKENIQSGFLSKYLEGEDDE